MESFSAPVYPKKTNWADVAYQYPTPTSETPGTGATRFPAISDRRVSFAPNDEPLWGPGSQPPSTIPRPPPAGTLTLQGPSPAVIVVFDGTADLPSVEVWPPGSAEWELPAGDMPTVRSAFGLAATPAGPTSNCPGMGFPSPPTGKSIPKW